MVPVVMVVAVFAVMIVAAAEMPLAAAPAVMIVAAAQLADCAALPGLLASCPSWMPSLLPTAAPCVSLVQWLSL